MIVKKDNKYILYTSDGKKILGYHNSRGDARRQEMAINYAKIKEAFKK